MRSVLWMAVFSACLLGATVNSVELDQYRRWRKSKEKLRQQTYGTSRGNNAEKAKIHNPGRVAKNFVPNGNRCCKIGEKTAKKRMPCVGIYAAARKINNYVHKAKIVVHRKGEKRYAKVLTAKIDKCSVAFSKKFEKCCRMRAEYYRHMKKCRGLKRSERKRCREMIKRRYRS